MTSVAVTLAEWAAGLEPEGEDLELAHRSLLDTVAVTLAARDHRVTRLADGLPEGARWAVAGHVLDFDDLHMPSTTHVSLEYAAAAALLDGYAGFGSFTDEAVRRVEARRLVGLVEVKLDPGGDWLLDGELEAEVHLADGTVLRARQQYPPGSPARPPTPDQLAAKLADCVHGLAPLTRDGDPASWTWDNAAETLRRYLP